MATAEKSSMKYRYLGNTGVKVSEICLGAMTFGLNPQHPRRCTEEESVAILNRFAEAGGNFIDTANVYNMGLSEEIIGKWLKTRRRRDFVLATKGRGGWDKKNINCVGLSRLNIIQSVEDSLRRLQTSYIDLYQPHHWDAATPIEETLSTLSDLVQQGKIRYIGVSNVTGWQLQKTVMLCRHNNWAPVITLQQQWSLLARGSEYELIDVCRNEGIGVLPWSPLKGGWLTGKIKKGDVPADTRVGWITNNPEKGRESHPSYQKFADNDRVWRLLEILHEIAKSHGKSVAQVALKWLLQKDTVPAVIIGVNSLAQLEDNLGATGDWRLTDQQMNDLDNTTAPEDLYPYMSVRNTDRQRTSKCF